MNVIDVMGEIAFVADGMFPIAPLPKRELTTRMTFDRNACDEQFATVVSFDAAPASREVLVSLRQGQNRMQMIRQDNNGVDYEGSLLTSGAKGCAQRADMTNESRRVAFRQGYRKEIRSALDAVPPVFDHADMLAV